jgi:hypothetical protein
MICKRLPNHNEVTLDTPLRLGIAAPLAFLDGSMTAAGPRREVFMLDPIPDQDLASTWAKLGTSWRDGAIIKRVL